MKVLKIGAAWCAGCLIMKPRWAKIEKDNEWLDTEYYDYDTDNNIIEKYKIDNILPVFIFLDKNGDEFMRLNGEIKEDKLIDIINLNKDK